ncbi:unnamed protein product [Trichogramma brassicae]|uniref:Uncharacterized protein n=1 Tax=Trichogramma brassicae TaxID=86971 RepID=A0A6H5J580_9HYME|nr:unnamed protein product [Trichogramma brassicae]
MYRHSYPVCITCYPVHTLKSTPNECRGQQLVSAFKSTKENNQRISDDCLELFLRFGLVQPSARAGRAENGSMQKIGFFFGRFGPRVEQLERRTRAETVDMTRSFVYRIFFLSKGSYWRHFDLGTVAFHIPLQDYRVSGFEKCVI